MLENIGLLDSFADTWLGLTDWMWVDVKNPSARGESVHAEIDWEAALYHGHTAAGEVARRGDSRGTSPAAAAIAAPIPVVGAESLRIVERAESSPAG